MLDADPFLGRVLTGRIEFGRVKAGQTIKAMTRDGKEIERGRVTKVLAFRGLRRGRSRGRSRRHRRHRRHCGDDRRRHHVRSS